MRHSRLHAHLVAAFAAAHCIRLRAAQGHRARGSSEWRTWLADRAAAPAQLTVVSAAVQNEGSGEDVIPGPVGLQAEIGRARAECRDLAAEIQRLGGHDVGVRCGLIRTLNESRRTLRELEGALVSIMEQAGAVVPVASVVAYAAQIRAVVETLPGRLATILPSELAAEVRARATAEVEAVLSICQTIRIEPV